MINFKPINTNNLAADGVILNEPAQGNTITSVQIGQPTLDPITRDTMFSTKEGFDHLFTKAIKEKYKILSAHSNNNRLDVDWQACRIIIRAYAAHVNADLTWIKDKLQESEQPIRHWTQGDFIKAALIKGYKHNLHCDQEFFNELIKSGNDTFVCDQQKQFLNESIESGNDFACDKDLNKEMILSIFDTDTANKFLRMAAMHPDSILGQLMKAVA